MLSGAGVGVGMLRGIPRYLFFKMYHDFNYEISKVPKIDFSRCTMTPKNDLPKCTEIPRFIQNYPKLSTKVSKMFQNYSRFIGFT